eukprot:2911545-Rhodomonas_salina.2
MAPANPSNLTKSLHTSRELRAENPFHLRRKRSLTLLAPFSRMARSSLQTLSPATTLSSGHRPATTSLSTTLNMPIEHVDSLFVTSGGLGLASKPPSS